ncbi:MAG TPA: hypothetical protein VNT79_14910 [Phycisphaerae bacterium]|nr:hypothetical protein [Phycisphaerae bacterium]
MGSISTFFHELFIQPKIITGFWRLVLLVPLALSISTVYKTIRCQRLSAIPLAAANLCLMIVVGMLLVGAVLLITFRLMA